MWDMHSHSMQTLGDFEILHCLKMNLRVFLVIYHHFMFLYTQVYMQNFLNILSACLSMQLHSWIVLQKLSELEPADLQWSGQKTDWITTY